MAAVGAFGQPQQHAHQPQWSSAQHTSSGQSPPPMHGRKRRAENSLETEQRLSKRLDLLNLGTYAPPSPPPYAPHTSRRQLSNSSPENGPRLYIPVGGPDSASPSFTTSQEAPAQPISPVTSSSSTTHAHRKQPHPHAEDTMLVEDTPHRIYIHDLSAELSDVESDEEKPIFLSDIEKHIAKIPQHVLTGPELRPTKDNQLILYQVPSSLSVPEEQDKVRRAIVEARARVREKQASPVREIGIAGGSGSVSGSGLRMVPRTPASTPVPMAVEEVEEDPDAMEIDG